MPEIAGAVVKDGNDRTSVGTAELRPQQFNVIEGTAGPDILIGTLEDDLIRGFGGDDDIRGRAGNDELYGNAGNDLIRGQDGDDTIVGGFGDDELYGNAGSDVIRGQAGDDTIFGGAGRDELRGGGGNDVVFGQGGDDVIFGGNGDDELHGGGGNDLIRGQNGNDAIFGGFGDDELHGNAGQDELFGGGGNDLLFGGNGDDILRGQGGNDDLRGGGGDDLLLGGRGDDILRGHGGNDILNGGAGADRMIGGPGADVFRFTVNDGFLNRIMDFDPDEGDTLDIDAIVDFQLGDHLDDFVRFDQVVQGTLVSIDPLGTGGDANFTPLVLLVGAEIESLTRAQLGLPRGFVAERTIASTTAEGTLGNSVSFVPALSQDGRFVSFASSATNFIEDDSATFDVFVKDLQTGAMERVSETAPDAGGNAGSFFSDISADGNRVAFSSFANNFPGDPNPSLDQADVFVADRAADTLQFVSIENNTSATMPSISDDGTLVAFQATATGRAETPGAEGPIIPRIFLRDLTDNSLREVSTSADDEFADAESLFSDISADGRFVAFDSDATNLTEADTNPAFDVFRKNLDDGSIELVSVTAAGQQDEGRGARVPSISGDGRFVAFQTEARLAPDDPVQDSISDIYVKDMLTGEIRLVSTSAAGVKGNAESLSPSISDDGSLVAFRSAADNLVPGDDNGVHDIFVKNLTTGDILRFEVDGDTSGLGLVSPLRPSLSGDGSTVALSDQVTVTGGQITASQVVVAPVDFGSAPAAVASLDSLLAPADVQVG